MCVRLLYGDRASNAAEHLPPLKREKKSIPFWFANVLTVNKSRTTVARRVTGFWKKFYGRSVYWFFVFETDAKRRPPGGIESSFIFCFIHLAVLRGLVNRKLPANFQFVSKPIPFRCERFAPPRTPMERFRWCGDTMIYVTRKYIILTRILCSSTFNWMFLRSSRVGGVIGFFKSRRIYRGFF